MLVPDEVPDVEGYVRTVIEAHRSATPERCGIDAWLFGGVWDGAITPPGGARGRPLTWMNNRCPTSELRLIGAAIITPDGVWHDRETVSRPRAPRRSDAPPTLDEDTLERRWEEYARRLAAEHPDTLAVALQVHT